MRETMSEAAKCVNTGPPLTRSTSTKPKEGLAMKATCLVTECDRPAQVRGACRSHSSRYYRYGTLEIPARPTPMQRIAAERTAQARREGAAEATARVETLAYDMQRGWKHVGSGADAAALLRAALRGDA